ncbi:spore germination lipoprotein GerD [Tumebacillus permanentifrigoris]|uniref:Spore germination protein D n=1 Tax=Tumebacillus permanentifrigoris TaxID=378543 RepID=A0A316D7U8_9BACL|nr:spore germination lipoprotein GerD [Tumebacillus permanentifrigoris]PWK05708.1 spore germination protein D [Tumebacillus permanentifrigoris]
MKRPWKIGTMIALAMTVAISGCGSKGGSSGSGGSASTASQSSDTRAQYNETKQMVLDILHTKEGLDTLKDIVRDPQFKNSLAINEADVSVAMQKALTDSSSHYTLMEQMKSPKFATAIAKTFQKDNEKILKSLMNDPEYQEMMLTLLKSPDFTRTLYDLMKTPEYRKQTMDIMTQSLQNPEFRLMYMELVKEAIRQGTESRTPNQQKATGQAQTSSTGEKKEGGGEEKGKEEKKEGEGEKKEGEKKEGDKKEGEKKEGEESGEKSESGGSSSEEGGSGSGSSGGGKK